MIAAPPRTILEVFESLPEGTLAQLVNNQIIISPAPTTNHQQTIRKIVMQLNNFVEANDLGEIFFAPLDVYFTEQNIYQPDILFISNQRQHIIEDGKIDGAPDLVIEVLSKGTEKLDRITKKAVYEKCGVLEYWIVDPKTKSTNGYKLQNGKFIDIPSLMGTISSVLLNTTFHF